MKTMGEMFCTHRIVPGIDEDAERSKDLYTADRVSLGPTTLESYLAISLQVEDASKASTLDKLSLACAQECP